MGDIASILMKACGGLYEAPSTVCQAIWFLYNKHDETLRNFVLVGFKEEHYSRGNSTHKVVGEG